MRQLWRKLDNTAKVFSLDEGKNKNTFRLSAILKEVIDSEILKLAVMKTLDMYPSYKVKIKTGFFWNYLETNEKEIMIEEENQVPCESIDFRKNNDYLFKVTYFKNKINIDMFHVLTDGMGAILFFKAILYQYLNLKYGLKTKEIERMDNISFTQDAYLKNADKKLTCDEKYKKAFLIQEKSNMLYNKTYHYILNLEKFKNICKTKNVSITEYLTALYIYAIYKTIYDPFSKKDIAVTVPIDLRKYYNVQSFSNFFTCMNIEGKVVDRSDLSFDTILNQVHQEFKNKLVIDKIKSYLARDVNLGTNIAIRLVPLFVKKLFMKYLGKLVSQTSTTTLSNIGSIKLEEQYQNYIDNIMALVSAGRVQKVKCTICSYGNNLTVTINSNLIDHFFEDEFYCLLQQYIGDIKLESNVI